MYILYNIFKIEYVYMYIYKKKYYYFILLNYICIFFFFSDNLSSYKICINDISSKIIYMVAKIIYYIYMYMGNNEHETGSIYNICICISYKFYIFIYFIIISNTYINFVTI